MLPRQIFSIVELCGVLSICYFLKLSDVLHDFVTLSLAESNNRKVHSAGDLQNVE
jgi:hypothetical protein